MPVHMYVPVTLEKGGSIAGTCGRGSEKGGMGLLPFTAPHPRIKCIFLFQWQVEEKQQHNCRGTTKPCPHQR